MATAMKSLRLDPELENRLQQAARARGESLSQFIRTAAAERADATLDAEPATDFSDVLGVVRGGGGRADHTGAAFAELLSEPAPNR
jgi:predicted DNA-binding protein